MDTQICPRKRKRKHNRNNEIVQGSSQGSSQGVLNYNLHPKLINDEPILISDSSSSDDENNSNSSKSCPCTFIRTNDAVLKIIYIDTNNNTRQKQLFPEYCMRLFYRMQFYLYDRKYNEILRCIKTPLNMSVKDILTVFSPQSWLNDMVLNDFLHLLKAKSNNTVWVFSTFFLNSYMKYGYVRVLKDTKDVDIFTKKKLLIPVHKYNLHWTLICVDIERKSIHLYDSFNKVNSTDFYIFAYVSMYLFEEHMVKKQCIINLEGWKYFIGNSPIQQNGFDCGVFVCMNSVELSRHTQPSYAQEDMPLLRHLITYTLLKDILEGY